MAAKKKDPSLVDLREPKQVQRGNGDIVTVGKCPRCNKNCTLSSANNKGVTCRKCKLQFNLAGQILGATVRLAKDYLGELERWVEAELEFDDQSLDEAVHDSKGEEAAAINNAGLAAQIEYLCGDMTVDQAKKHLQGLKAGGES